jgi:hypothetical protein
MDFMVSQASHAIKYLCSEHGEGEGTMGSQRKALFTTPFVGSPDVSRERGLWTHRRRCYNAFCEWGRGHSDARKFP